MRSVKKTGLFLLFMVPFFASCSNESQTTNNRRSSRPVSDQSEAAAAFELTTVTSGVPPEEINAGNFANAVCYQMFYPIFGVKHHYVGCVITLRDGRKSYRAIGALIDTEADIFKRLVEAGRLEEFRVQGTANVATFFDYTRWIEGVVESQVKCPDNATCCNSGLGALMVPFTLGYSKPCYVASSNAISDLQRASIRNTEPSPTGCVTHTSKVACEAAGCSWFTDSDPTKFGC